jgi:N-acyl-L-homoserine lactone synthetase
MASDHDPEADILRIGLAAEHDRPAIYRLRHEVFARELRQHCANEAGQLRDHVDDHNLYLVVKRRDELIGCISM